MILGCRIRTHARLFRISFFRAQLLSCRIRTHAGLWVHDKCWVLLLQTGIQYFSLYHAAGGEGRVGGVRNWCLYCMISICVTNVCILDDVSQLYLCLDDNRLITSIPWFGLISMVSCLLWDFYIAIKLISRITYTTHICIP